MDTIARTDSKARERRSPYLVNADDDLVQVFLRKSDRCEVVIAMLDEHGRPTTVARWDAREPDLTLPGAE